MIADLQVGEGEPEAAQQKGSFSLPECALVRTVAVAVAVLGELGGDSVEGGERAWVQYAHRRDKEIIELRRRAEEPRFPGFSRFDCSLHEIDTLPATWLEALRTSRGVYLLVDRETGAQYVGSASGEDGFIGRWRGYANGHGGNAAMRDLAYGPDRYRVWVLETVGSSATYQDVCDLESLWKEKLGSRAKGLNRN